MRFRDSYSCILLLTLLLALAGACAAPPPQSPEGVYYLTTDMTYLRDAAAFDSNVVGQLYKGDQVEKLETGPANWWRVRSERTGQVGWVSAYLFSPAPAPVPLFFVKHTVNLRECAKDLCPSLQLLSLGDRVQKIEQNDQGWWRVLVVDSRNLGWLPAEALAESLEEARAEAPEKPYLYVAVRRLKLFRQPQPEAEVVKLLQVNDQVVKLDQNETGWFKVRHPASGAVGWVLGRYLEPLPVRYPRPEKHKKTRAKPTKPAGTKPQPEPQAEPEIM
jgi:uncharacterized protein YgiM (DUF1202 family)